MVSTGEATGRTTKIKDHTMKTLKAFDIFVSNNGKVTCKTIQAETESQATAQVEGTIIKVIDLGLVGEWGDDDAFFSAMLESIAFEMQQK